MDTVCVLLSTYNGERYLEEQLDSVLSQRGVDVKLLIRDDGSTDGTIEIIYKYANTHTNIELIYGENKGPALSFLELLTKAPKMDYYAFCDQDDYWKEEKLFKAIQLMKNESSDIPVLYYSNLTITDSKLNVIRNTKLKKLSNRDRYVPLVDNLGTGCTMVLNKKLADLILTHKPTDITMHDAWCNIVCSLWGTVIFDTNSYILYRQHDNNTIGMDTKTNVVQNVRMHFGRIINTSFQPRFQNAVTLWECFQNELSVKDKKKICKIIKYKDSIINRFLLLSDFSIHSYSVIKDLRYRLLIILGEI